jgi:hypothetical protein
MPYHFEFDSENRILLLVAEGDVQDAELLVINDVVGAHVKALQPAAGISDLSAITSFQISSDAVSTAALQPSPYPEETPRFIVAPQDHIFGMSRMFEMIGSRTRAKLKIVRNRDEALAAIGVKNPKFERVKLQ